MVHRLGGVSLGEMSGNDIAMSGGSIPLQVVNGSSVGVRVNVGEIWR